MKKVKPICKVGECYAYQNVGFNMITSAIERVDHKPYTVSVKERLFEPLGMLDASFGSGNLKHQGNWARSYSRKKDGPWKIRRIKDAYYNVPAAGGVNASITDMTKWLSAQMGYAPDILPRSTLRLLHTPLVRTPREMMRNRRMTHLTNAHYGLGWRIYEYAGKNVINHSGSTNSRTDEFWSILPVFLDAELGLDNPLLVD